MIPITIADPRTGNGLDVTNGVTGVVRQSYPNLIEPVEQLPFSQSFTADGLSTGATDMRVDGSVTSQEFFIKALPDRDYFINTISIQISDNQASLDQFGNIGVLSNGLDFNFTSLDDGVITIQGGITTNLDMVRIGLGSPALGDGTSAFRADTSGAGADTYLPTVDFRATFGLTWGLRLRKGSNNQLSMVINDNLTGLDSFNIISFGFLI